MRAVSARANFPVGLPPGSVWMLSVRRTLVWPPWVAGREVAVGKGVGLSGVSGRARADRRVGEGVGGGGEGDGGGGGEGDGAEVGDVGGLDEDAGAGGRG